MMISGRCIGGPWHGEHFNFQPKPGSDLYTVRVEGLSRGFYRYGHGCWCWEYDQPKKNR